MENQTKNIITREFIQKELRFSNKADTSATVVLGFVLSLVFVPLTVCVVHIMINYIASKALGSFLAVLFGVPMSAPVIILFISLLGCLAERRRLSNGDFEILVLPLEYKREVFVHRHTENSLFFKDFKRISVDSTEYELASQGDKYYIVRYNNKNIIELLYPLKMYEYIER